MPPELSILVVPFICAFVVSMLFGPGMISALKRRKVGQTISEDGPESHRPKAGTPTMGGLIILAGILAGALVIIYAMREVPGVRLPDLTAVLLLMIGFALLGLVDDYLTIHPIKGIRGIASKPKAAAQVLLAIAFVMWLASHREGFSPILYYANTTPILSGWLYWVFSVVFIVGMANFVNITDGLDGLVTGLTGIVTCMFVLIALIIPAVAVDRVPSLASLFCAIGGACLAFLWFNANPAKVFMGDTGSLALGVALPAVAILTHRELLMIVLSMVFILDGLSTAVQWAWFKYTRITTGTGRRIFKKSPIHHHFELSGWPEQSIVIRFWIAGIIAAVIGFIGAGARIW